MAQTSAAQWAAFAASRMSATESGGPLVIGVRGLSVDGRRHDTQSKAELDDVVVVLVSGTARVLAVSTHPFEKEGGRGVPDVNGDGKPDVATIRPGEYVVSRDPQRFEDAPVLLLRTMAGQIELPAWRDSDQDGVISRAERTKSERDGHTARRILFHAAGPSAPPAVGCQVTDPSSMRTLAELTQKAFRYLLVDAASIPELPPLE